MNFCDDLIKQILYFLPNEDIITIHHINKQFNNIIRDNTFKDIIRYRRHPMVFNILGNFCYRCNLKIVFLCDYFNFIRCNHFDVYHNNYLIYEPRIGNL